MEKAESRELNLALPGQREIRPPRRWRAKVHQSPPKVLQSPPMADPRVPPCANPL